jgi:hypothetical protein
LNLIRVMPAKGQDIVTTSIFLARLIGPFAFAIGLAMLTRRDEIRSLANEVLASPALMFLTGLITFPAGLAIVLTHNVWTPDWRVAVTLLGWLAVISGAVRILAPQRTAGTSRRLLAHPLTLHIGTAIYLGAGALLCFFGYFHH